MISDVLADAVAEIDRYLDSPEWWDTYTGATRKELKALRTLMDAARTRLDTPPETPREVVITVRRGVILVRA
ncbi:MAG: hypothetical protein EPO42_06825 [Gallionellaceae bacterium]|nr:MAG: hypothetical protein EPO42_06825 [Gallionellaceae bacterium]